MNTSLQKYGSNFIQIDSTFGLSKFVETHKERNENLLSFFAGNSIPSQNIHLGDLPVPIFTEPFTFQDLLEIEESLANIFLSSDRLASLLDCHRNKLDHSTCCGAEFVRFIPVPLGGVRKFFMLGSGISKPSIECLRSYKQGRFYFPERGIFSISDSYLSLILDDLSEKEVVFPVLDLSSGFPSQIGSLDFDYLVEESESIYPLPIPKDKILFCSKCFSIFESRINENTYSFNELAEQSKDLKLLALLGIGELSLEDLENIEDGERVAFLKLCFKILSSHKDLVLVGLLRAFSSSYRRILRKFVSFLVEEGRVIYIADSGLVAGAKYLGMKSCDVVSVPKRKPAGCDIRFLPEYSVPKGILYESECLFLVPELACDKQKRLRFDTNFGSFIGILPVFRKLYLMHPISKSLGLANSDFMPSSSRYACEACKGSGQACKNCHGTGLSEFIDEIELHGIGYRSSLSLNLRELSHTFSFVKEIAKISNTYLAVGLDYIALKDIIRDLLVEEFALMLLVRDGLPILKKSGQVLLKDLFFDFDIRQLLMIRDYLQSMEHGKVLVVDKSQIANIAFRKFSEKRER